MVEQESGISFDDEIDEILDEYTKLWTSGYYAEEASGNYETWKNDYSDYLQENIVAEYDLTNISPDEVEAIIEVLNERVAISQYIPAYMIGGQSGGEAWGGFKKLSRENPDEAAEVLSRLFDHSIDVTERLTIFEDHYGVITEEYSVSGGPLMTLATCLLMFLYPDRYIQYKYGMMKGFFSEFTNYKVGRGYNPTGYEEINKACLSLRDELRTRIEGASMIHVHNVVLYWEDLLERAENETTGVPGSSEDEAMTDTTGTDDTATTEYTDGLPAFDLSDEPMPEGLYFEDWERIRNQIETTLNSGKNIIFTGPPGTGKTKLAKWVSDLAVEQDRVDGYKFTTATADWTAFDTIGGYTPSTDGQTQELQFQPRLFLDCFRDGDDVVNRWLIIDEINRADIDKAFGPLFSVLSKDSVELQFEYEDTGHPVQLSWRDDDTEGATADVSPHVFPVTPSWRLIATMNTQDKASLYEMSYAFMRRFNFIHVGVPAFDDGAEQGEAFLRPYISEDVWDMDVPSDQLESVARLWAIVNQERPIGPAVIEDILTYVTEYPIPQDGSNPTQPIADAVVSLVFPQLEGMRPDDQKSLVRSMAQQLGAEGETLESTAEDFFGIDLTDE